MNLKNKNIVFCLTSSFYAFESIILQIKELVKEGANIIPIMSYDAYNSDSKFGKDKDFIKEIEEITGNIIIHTTKEAEEIGRKNIIDITIICPCTGNTVAKLANGIVDTPVVIAVSSHLKNDNPVVIGIYTNDGLSRKC